MGGPYLSDCSCDDVAVLPLKERIHVRGWQRVDVRIVVNCGHGGELQPSHLPGRLLSVEALAGEEALGVDGQLGVVCGRRRLHGLLQHLHEAQLAPDTAIYTSTDETAFTTVG